MHAPNTSIVGLLYSWVSPIVFIHWRPWNNPCVWDNSWDSAEMSVTRWHNFFSPLKHCSKLSCSQKLWQSHLHSLEWKRRALRWYKYDYIRQKKMSPLESGNSTLLVCNWLQKLQKYGLWHHGTTQCWWLSRLCNY